MPHGFRDPDSSVTAEELTDGVKVSGEIRAKNITKAIIETGVIRVIEHHADAVGERAIRAKDRRHAEIFITVRALGRRIRILGKTRHLKHVSTE